jgi:hypothetical protein
MLWLYSELPSILSRGVSDPGTEGAGVYGIDVLDGAGEDLGADPVGGGVEA